MARLFGTDGVRGVAGRDLTASLALDLATAAAQVLTDGEREGPRPLAVVGRDPRASGEFLEAAVVAGLASAGVDVVRLGVLPTPAVAHLTDELGADFGVMLSASHNPAPDNGIKFFARGGHKLPDTVEDAIEARLGQPVTSAVGADVGRVTDAADGAERYIRHVVSTLPQNLDGLKVVLDCANGASHEVGPEALRRAGAEVITIGDQPNGLNINEGCGSTHLDTLRAAVREHGADAGIAHDGDADRCLAVAADGSVVDGDQILAILALELQEAGRLAGDTLVVTVMSNLGLKLAMRAAGITVLETPVGDRYVLEAMRAGGHSLGGEQSGHVVLLDHASTGDGLLTGLHLLGAMSRRGLALAELAKVMTRLPQVLVNVRGVDKSRAASSPEIAAAVAAAEAELGDQGRVLIRPSGTEPMIRVMVEAAAETQAHEVADRLAGVVRAALG
ncbi:phosphoglucosamine mutase [Marinitenerispora sediminis]|uniref:Phosphoglucosamine mutase n=1 Tax=Marinitenerispora sediminis TaxID=1931232 RepID=A0A368T233_9ACTN|nr:phosphoglucosamine mutase [Marinitenerispora sediminis]RCV51463.1 phosphoglucosamine mutase [Marinitenerispora sediminis]RCV54559.1 phosphoglucosamine mutase [Marinitenerispora sediminis]RCV55231.1 phosphoglucosamine mutase [Marinitenerispora sediminis]